MYEKTNGPNLTSLAQKLVLLDVVRVQEVPISASDHDLPGDDNLVVHLIADRAALLVLRSESRKFRIWLRCFVSRLDKLGKFRA